MKLEHKRSISNLNLSETFLTEIRQFLGLEEVDKNCQPIKSID